jgi:hypothetical protein
VWQRTGALGGAGPSGRLVAVRDAQQTANILGGVQPDNLDSYYRFDYDTQGRVTYVDEPKPNAAATTWLRRTFTYAGAEDGFPAVTRVGAPNAAPQPASGWARQVYFDGTGRARAEKDRAGRRSWLYWAADRDVVTASVDPAGRMSTQVVDHRGRTIQAHGPAPAACFGGYVPSTTPPVALAPTSAAGNCAAIPRTDTGYDAQNGLAFAGWNNTATPAAPSAGPPVRHGLMTFNGSTLQVDWGLGAPPGLPADHFSLRLSGSINFPSAGVYEFRAIRDDGMRVTIADTKVIDGWSVMADTVTRGRYTVTAPGDLDRLLRVRGRCCSWAALDPARPSRSVHPDRELAARVRQRRQYDPLRRRTDG